MAFKYTLNFVTAADLAGAVAAEKAVAKVGTAADEAGDKLDKMAESGKSGGDSLVESLGNAGEKGGEGLVGKLNTKLTALGPAVLIPAALGIGTAIGSAIGGAIEDVFTGEMDDKLADLFALTFSQKAQVAGERFRQTLHTEMAQLNRELLKEQEDFWKEYMNAAPKNAGDWLVDISTKASKAQDDLRRLSEIQLAVAKAGKSQAEQDFLDEKHRIENDPDMTPEMKMQASQANEAKKSQSEFQSRQTTRGEQSKNVTYAVKDKEVEVEELRLAEEMQLKRRNAAKLAEDNARRTLEETTTANGVQTKDAQDAIRKQAYNKAGQEYGVDIEPGQNEEAVLMKNRDERFKAERELEKMKLDAAKKQQALQIENAADIEATAREQKRRAQDNARALEAERHKAWESEEKGAMKREQDLDKDERAGISPVPERDLPKPGQEQTLPESTEDMREKLRIMSQTTGDAGLKMALETLKNKLSDGGSAAELKEAAALMERAQSGNNDAVRQMAAAMRAAVESQNSALKAAMAEIASLRATVEAGKQRS